MINKKTSPKGKSVRVTFELPADLATDSAAVVGDFNEWNPLEGEMKFVKTRKVWKKDLSLEAGNSYQFRYVLDGANWQNDEDADGFAPNEYFSENGVIEL